MLYNKKQLEEIIPHRFEMSLLDGIESIDEKTSQITGIINLTDKNWFFRGHFPQEPVMPGVLQVEALAQTGAVWLLSQEKYKGRIAYFAGIKKVKFKDKVTPGQTIKLKVEMVKMKDFGKKGALGTAIGKVTINEKVVTEAELSFFVG